jgi:hypothetical protein
MGARFFRREVSGACQVGSSKKTRPHFPRAALANISRQSQNTHIASQKQRVRICCKQKEKGRKCPKYALELRGDIS